jgi:hypothetical protein
MSTIPRLRHASVLLAIVAASLLLPAAATNAQPRTADPAQRGVPLSAFPRFVKLSPHVYGYEEIRQPGFTTVSLIVIGKDGVRLAAGHADDARPHPRPYATPHQVVRGRLRPR